MLPLLLAWVVAGPLWTSIILVPSTVNSSLSAIFQCINWRSYGGHKHPAHAVIGTWWLLRLWIADRNFKDRWGVYLWPIPFLMVIFQGTKREHWSCNSQVKSQLFVCILKFVQTLTHMTLLINVQHAHAEFFISHCHHLLPAGHHYWSVKQYKNTGAPPSDFMSTQPPAYSPTHESSGEGWYFFFSSSQIWSALQLHCC